MAASHSSGGTVPIPPASSRIAAPGLLVIGYHSNPSAVELAADKFNQYLKEEGLDAVAALRAQRNETGAKAREMFSRCAKSLVLSGSATEGQGDRSLGFPLELVAERNPYALRAGQDLPVRLTYENRPLQGALVVAINRRNPSEKLTARTDKDGRVRFRLRQSGMWLVKAVHMVPAPAGSNAEWASFWASLTFELRPANVEGQLAMPCAGRRRYRSSRAAAGGGCCVSSRVSAPPRFARMRSARRACRSSSQMMGPTTLRS